jgi:hypothetical protein
MTPSFSAQSDGKSIRVYAALLVNASSPKNSGFAELDMGDGFTATVNGSTLDLVEEPSPSDNHIHYTATFPQPSGNANVVISFQRPAGMASAPMTTVTLPAPFTVAGAIPATFHRGDLLPITLSPEASPLPVSGGRATLAFDGPCMPGPIGNYEYPLAPNQVFTGRATFDTHPVLFADELDTGPQTKPLECDVAVHVRADTLGKADPAFKSGGDIEGLLEQIVMSHIAR